MDRERLYVDVCSPAAYGGASLRSVWPATRVCGRHWSFCCCFSRLRANRPPCNRRAVSEGLAWQWIFWINVPIGLIAIPLVLGRIPESFGPLTHLDIGGLLLVTGAALALVWALMRGNVSGWASTEVLTSLLVGTLLGVIVGNSIRLANEIESDDAFG